MLSFRGSSALSHSNAESRRHAFPVRMVLSVLMSLAVVASVVVPTAGAFAAEPAAVRNVKTADATVVGPGDTFNWKIEVGCSVLDDECVNAVLTDTIPSEFIPPAPGDILLTPAFTVAERTITVVGQTVTIAFLQNLASPAGQKGLTNGTVTVTIPVTVRSDLDYTPTFRTVTNTSQMVADNAPMVPSSASVDIIVPLELATVPTKSFSPATNISVAGLGTQLTLGASNTSNAAVSSLAIQDPVNPSAVGNIFRTALELQSLDSVTWPTGATSAVVSLWDTSLATPAWVDAPSVSAPGPLLLPGSVLPADAGGIRIVFSSGSSADIPRNASTQLVLGLENRTGITAATYPNTARSEVVRDALNATAPVTANYVVTAATSDVSAGKSITPDRMSTEAFGATDLTTGTVTLTGGNAGSVPLGSLTISEPSDPTSLAGTNPLSPNHIGGGLIFSGFTSGVIWPAGATSANITYYFEDGSSSVLPATSPGLPASGSITRVTGFSVTFMGTMAQGVVATIPFTITANPAQEAPDLSVLYTNQVRVTGDDVYSNNVGPKFASDTVTVLAEQVNLRTSKSLSRTNLRAANGQSTAVTLTTKVLDYPDSTRALDHIDMIDPSTETGLTEWYEYFDATSLVVTPVPGNATLTISYRDAAGNYTPLTVLGPGIQNYDIPPATRGNIYGLKLSWDTTTGFQPGQSLEANIGYALRSTLRDSAVTLPNAAKQLENCSASMGTAGTAPDGITSNTATSDPCPKVTLVPYDDSGTGGGANLLDKNFINTNNTNAQGIMNTRNSQQTRARLSWSTDGYTGVNQMVIYDGAVDSSGNPAPSAWDRGMYDAYDLASVPNIAAIDPLMQYDKVSIKFFDRSALPVPAWVEIPGYCTVAAPCNGGVGTAHTLTPTERLNFVAVQFTFTEGSNRPGLNPSVGSGVADSIGHNRRIDLVFQMRDTLRSNAAWPVVDGYRYNEDLTVGPPAHSVIRNHAWSEATLAAGGSLTDRASDTLQIRDVPLAAAATKTWTGGPIPIPDSTVTVRPTSRVTLTATNETPAKVNTLTISEPNLSVATPNDSPFEDWDLTRFQAITHPTGATGLTVTVNRTVGGPLTATGSTAGNTLRNVVLGWTSAQLENATSFTFVYTGQIAATSGTGTVVFDLGLRATKRSGGAIVAGTDYNSTEGTITDLRWDPTSSVISPTFTDEAQSARAGANIVLVASTISVTTSKTFATASETEPTRNSFRLTLTARPGGSERVQSLMVTDDRATFWNAFDFTGLATTNPQLTLPTFSPSPSTSGTVIQVEVCVGVSAWWTASAVAADPDASCTDRGGSWVGAGTWKTQAQARADFLPPLPLGVTAADVEGLRITVKRADNSQWENPQSPTINIPILVQRRVNLRTGDPVRTSLDGNPASPGETVPGTTTNSLSANVLGIWGKTATASNSASYQYRHAITGVRVQKGPSGVKAPGGLFDYTLTVTNTGGWPILNPVITDYLPSDGVGAQLIFDPDKPWTYQYLLTGAAPSIPTGTALPSGTSGPTVSVTADAYGPTRIGFTFPAGSVLEVGQTYVITIPMMFRPGLVNDTHVTNSFGIRGDRKFDTCTEPPGVPADYDSGTGECSTSTMVRPSEQAALRALMSVKAELDLPTYPDQGFTGGTNPACIAAQDTDGFSRLPCIPLTLPGQKETWRLTAQNTGTTNMPRLVLSARLPDVSDQTILDGFVRHSSWRAGFANEINANIGIPGATMTVYYTTASAPCKLVLQNPFNENACGNDPATGWAPWSVGVPSDPTTVTGLQFVIDFDDAHLFAPADTITIDIVTKTAALSATPGADTTANNSLSASAITRTGTTDTRVTALDYSVVSVALATGSVRLEKEITGPAASFVPDGQIFAGELVCTSLTETTTRPFTMTLSGGTVPAVQFDNLPGGADCEVTETTASGQTSYTTTTVTVDPRIKPPAIFPTIELKNDYQFGGLRVSKTVTTTAPVIPTDYAFTVVCTFLGVTVPLAAADASFTLDATESRTITGIPANSDCVVTETDPRGADATIVTAQTDVSNPGSAAAVNNAVPSSAFTRISPDDIDGVTNATTFNNRFDAPAALIITKNVLGGGGAQFGASKTFSVDVECTFGATTQYSGTLLLNAGNAWQAVLENIIAGSECTFTETDLQGADAVEITPNDGIDTTVGTVTVPGPTIPVPSPVVNINVNNWYLTGSVQVTKVFAGDVGAIDKFARNPVPEIEFEFALTCRRDGVDVVIPGGEIRTVTAAAPVADYTGIASGADCVLSETRRGGASLTRILDINGDPVVDGEFTITVDPTDLAATDQEQPDLDVENTYRFADVSAAKAVIDVPAGRVASTMVFEVTLTCTLDGRDIDAAEPAAATIQDHGAVTWTELAEGADCTVTETDTGGASKTTTALTQADGSIGSAVAGKTVTLAPLRWTGAIAPNQIRFVNSFELANTGSTGPSLALMWLPFGLLMGGLVLFGFPAIRRRRGFGPPPVQ